MRIVCISDTHNYHAALGTLEGDVLIHAGDFTSQGKQKSVIQFNNWLGMQKFEHKLVIAGNHDRIFQNRKYCARKLLTNGTYLEDSGVTIDGVKFYGSPWTPTFGWDGWVFNQDRDSPETTARWAKIPDDTDILITHGPPYGCQDKCPNRWLNTDWVSVGCDALTERLKCLNVKYNVCGHIHESHGIGTLEGTDTTVVNAAIMTGDYKPKNPPIVIDYEP